LSTAGRLSIATRIAAVTQLGNHFAVWTGTEAAGVPREDVSVAQLVGGTEVAEQTLHVTNEMIVETLDTGLFSSRGEERLGWSHQTLAEYLAARYCLTHNLSIEQLRSLVFHPRRARVIPQVREVASWLALQREELFGEIAEKDPEVLLGSAAPSLSPEQRSVLTDALLRSCDDSEILHVHHNLAVRHFAHPALAKQLEPVLRDRNRSIATRYFASQVARQCTVAGLGDALLDVALSDEETHDLRTAAAYAIADLGSGAERERMRPLLTATREIDPNDQLRGAALSAIYPGDKYAMWGYLEHPRVSLFGGSYSSFLYYSVVPKLNAENLSAALRWCQQQPIGTLLKANGEDVKTVQELLRHANSRITLEVYTQATTSNKRAAQSRVVRMMVPNLGEMRDATHPQKLDRVCLLHPYQTHDLCLFWGHPSSKCFRMMAGTTGLEPATSAVTVTLTGCI
jgi:hypothetical protein